MNKNDRKPSRSLFKRATDNLPPLALTERDLDILEIVEEYRLLNTPQIHALVNGHPRSLSNRLSALFHHGYLDRPIHQLQLRIEEQSPLIYSLSKKGARMLAEKRQRHDLLARVSRRVAQGKSPYLAHSVMVSQFRACLSLACQERGDVAFTRWQIPERRLAQVVLAGYKVPVIPDAHFSLSRDGHSVYFFLEADRGTMSHPRFLRKLQAYWALRQTQLEGFPVKAFRVLTITTSAKRMGNLLDASRRADPNQTGSLMFYFTCEDTYSLEYPEVLLAPIWRSPGDDNVHSLLEGGNPANSK